MLMLCVVGWRGNTERGQYQIVITEFFEVLDGEV